MFEVAVLGGGPAGLAAAMYSLRKGVDTHLIAAHIGGKTTASFNLPDMSEYHLLKAREQVQVFRARLEYLAHTYRVARITAVAETEGGFELSVEHDDQRNVLQAERLIITLGVYAPAIEAPGVAEFFGRALGSSAISYSHLLADRDVCIIGNSDRCISAAVECAQQSATVTVVLEAGAEVSPPHLEMAIEREGITVLQGMEVARIEGEDFANAVVVRPPAGGRRASSRQEQRVSAQAIFIEREPTPNSGLVKHLVRRDERGYIQIDSTGRTSHPRIYAAGDITTGGYEQVLVALGAGARAGISAYEDLLRRDQRRPRAVS